MSEMTSLTSAPSVYAASGIEDLEKSGVNMATSPLQVKANEIRANRVNWQPYYQSHMISDEDYAIIVKLDSQPQRAEILRETPSKCARALLSLMSNISKDQTVQYVVTLIDDILQEEKSRVEMFNELAKKNKESVWAPFFNMLLRPDAFTINQTSRIIAKMACWSSDLMEGNDLVFYLNWLKDQLKISGNEYLQSVARCLQMLLRINEYKQKFVELDGVAVLINTLQGKVGFQIQYQVIFCFWVLTFDPYIADRISKNNIIPILSDCLCEANKEKVTRIILATFRNLLEKPTEREHKTDNALAMIQCKVLKQLQLFESRKFEDTDISDDVQFINETLLLQVQDLSSFDEYSSEVKSGRLEWSPVHKSEKFWRENAARLNEKNFELLKILVKLLDTSRDPLILSVAAHDVGEYVRHYPRGKTFYRIRLAKEAKGMKRIGVIKIRQMAMVCKWKKEPRMSKNQLSTFFHQLYVIEQLGGKTLVMSHLSHEDPNVRYEALLAVQKLMVHNWEYLGKQLETPTGKDGKEGTVKS